MQSASKWKAFERGELKPDKETKNRRKRKRKRKGEGEGKRD
jgi:hypothetical protein